MLREQTASSSWTIVQARKPSRIERANSLTLVTFYNPSTKDMNAIFDDYLSTVDKSEKTQIISTLKNNDFARLEVLL